MTRLSFSRDSSVLQSNDVGKELLYWNSATGAQIIDSIHLRDVEWSTWSSICGWPVQVSSNSVNDAQRRSNTIYVVFYLIREYTIFLTERRGPETTP